MLDKLKLLFKSKDDKELSAAETEFDDRMTEVEGDITDLQQLETHVRKEFKDIEGDVTRLRQKIDEITGEKSPPKSK